MNKRDFEAAVRAELRKVPLATRRGWTGTNLIAWWFETLKANPHLVWDRCKGDPWQTVHGICLSANLIGEKAVL